MTRPWDPWTLLALASMCGALVACTAAGAVHGPVAVSRPIAADVGAAGTARGEQTVFAASTESPRHVSDWRAGPDERALNEACGDADASLLAVAARLAEAGASETERAIDADALSFALHAEGAPYVWPRAWLFSGSEGELGLAKSRMQRWLSTFSDGGVRRCGVRMRHGPGARITVGAVAVDALADLDALPTRTELGHWVEFRATLRVAASDAKLVVMGPRGSPHAVLTSFDGRRVAARFNADQPGVWVLQLLAAVEGGPRPLLEALVFAGTEPSRALEVRQAPGEQEARSIADPRAASYAMLNSARRSEGLSPLERDERLESLAQAHAEAMRRARKTAHDAGDGDLNYRLSEAGLELHAGENVAHAGSAALAQRALWASPSHRENLLFPRFNRVGVGLAQDADGTLWVCQVFAASS